MTEEFMTLAEWRAKGKSLFGPDSSKWRFICPICGHVASVQDWRDLGAENAIAFSCVGRFQEKNPLREALVKKGEKVPGPCDYTGGGLLKFNPIHVTDDDGMEESLFAFYEGKEEQSTTPC